MYTMQSQISGIPCLIKITNYFKQKPQGRGASSDWDCYGYSEAEWEVLDRKGYKANWLAKKLTSRDEDRINEEIEAYMES